MLASVKDNKSAFDAGHNIIIGGLILQLLSLAFLLSLPLEISRTNESSSPKANMVKANHLVFPPGLSRLSGLTHSGRSSCWSEMN